jgi:hypothetical protein
VHPILALALLAVLGILVARAPRRPSLPTPLGPMALVATGAPLALLGLLLGPGLGVLDRSTLRQLSPVMAVGVGWLGAVLGSRLPWRVLKRIPPRFYAVAALTGVAALGAAVAAALLLRRLVPAIAPYWQPAVPAILCLGAAAAVSGPGTVQLVARAVGLPRSRIRPLMLAAAIDTLVGAVGLTIALGLAHPMGSGRMGWMVWLVVLLGSGVLTGLLFLSITQDSEPTTSDLGLFLLGVVLLGSGVGYAANVSPFLVCLVASALIASFSPLRRRVAAVLLAWEGPVFGLFLVLAGALVALPTPWLIPAAMALVLARVLAKWLATGLGLERSSAGLALTAQGGVALAFGVNFVMAFGGGSSPQAQAVFTTIFLMIVLSRAVSAPLMKWAAR